MLVRQVEHVTIDIIFLVVIVLLNTKGYVQSSPKLNLTGAIKLLIYELSSFSPKFLQD